MIPAQTGCLGSVGLLSYKFTLIEMPLSPLESMGYTRFIEAFLWVITPSKNPILHNRAHK